MTYLFPSTSGLETDDNDGGDVYGGSGNTWGINDL